MKWIEVYDQCEGSYNTYKQIRFKTAILRSDLCDHGNAYIVAKWTAAVTDSNNNAYDQKLAFKNNAPFITCITIILINNIHW